MGALKVMKLIISHAPPFPNLAHGEKRRERRGYLTVVQPVVEITGISGVGKLLVEFLHHGIDDLIDERFVQQNIRHGIVFLDGLQPQSVILVAPRTEQTGHSFSVDVEIIGRIEIALEVTDTGSLSYEGSQYHQRIESDLEERNSL